MDNESTSGEQLAPAGQGTAPQQSPSGYPGQPAGPQTTYPQRGAVAPPRPAWATSAPTTAPTTAFGTPTAATATATRPRRNLRTLVAAVALSAVVGAGTGVGSYAVLDRPAPTSAVQVDAGTAPVSVQQDGTVGAAAEVISPSTVTIEVAGAGSSGLGTGIVVDTDGHVLTNQHVVEGAGPGGSIRVTLDDGRTVGATVVGESTSTDLAVIRLDGSEVDVATLTPATFAESASVTVGQTVVAVGAPLGLSKTVTSGVVSNTARPVRSGLTDEAVYQAVQTDAAINPGNSGGPLVDLSGRVVGINSSIASTADSGEQAGNIGIGFAIPADVARRVADDLIATGSSPDASLGVTLTGDDSGQDGTGAQVRSVQPGSAAEDGGLQAGDVITAVQDVRTPSADALIAAIRYWAPGTPVTVSYERDGRSATAEVTLGTA
ncbi:PDZ domain-containing protein [Auraticoccus sp. F435]|uniref:PDZ domain-containing protein n=1 Tax=Auraticoccus cholistanensis TaxID=2656650 RepID=A0A6A9UTZ4_9ACTN|nr:trypsin-like peptidase domain-containing protein [Auraticoccus cholistanensis]MVA75054.1 PDZ domain-containing protein [Auraticoccus cholistanensis]